MKNRNCCLAVVVAGAMILVLLCAFVFIFTGDPGHYSAYRAVKIGDTQQSVRARFSRLQPKYVDTFPAGQDPYSGPGAVTCLLIINDHDSQHYLFYLNGSGRVIGKRHYFD